MIDPLDPLEVLRRRARRLHKAVTRGDAPALERVRKLPELERLDPDAVGRTARRRHCLAVLALEQGFAGWSHLKHVVDGATEGDFGTGLYTPGHWNIWSASYDEASTIRREHGGFLLPYKQQFVIVDRHFIDTLGLDPDDPDWVAMERDWVRPRDASARRRLYGKLFDATQSPP